MKTQVQLIIATIFLAAIIWIYADQTSHQNYDTEVIVRLVSATDIVPKIVDPLPDKPDVIRVPVTLRGPKAAIQKRRVWDSARTNPFELKITVPDGLDTGVEYYLKISSELTQLQTIKDAGLHVVDPISEPTIKYTVDRYINVSLDVKVISGIYTTSVTIKGITPEKVQAKILESDYDLIGKTDKLEVNIQKYLDNPTGKTNDVFDVDLGSTWHGSDVTFNPGQIKVQVEFKQNRVPEGFNVLLGVWTKPGFFKDYEYLIEDESELIQRLKVSVPKAKAGQLTKEKITAYVKIDDDDLPTTTQPVTRKFPVFFHFPEDFKDVEVNDDTPNTATLTIKQKTEAEKSTPGSSAQ